MSNESKALEILTSPSAKSEALSEAMASDLSTAQLAALAHYTMTTLANSACEGDAWAGKLRDLCIGNTNTK